ncbi:MAG: carbohydrate ABC transporter substrate-binding protein [Hoeflea sp.]|uniref:carbohydrate ABC transporter substrate-binding protein n=1 Tax=Hoeflea sp. TaxID=1940281 RepID=UPI0032F0013F
MWKGLTWDHPRGFNALDAASRNTCVPGHGLISWDVQPLEGFESAPIDELCDRYDLVVLDHPHVGEAVEAGCLHSIEDAFGNDLITSLEAASIGPSLSSYRFADKHWALPLDAATQVMAVRPDLMADIPVEWDDVLALVDDGAQVAASVAGPHAALSFLSICAALGEPPAVANPEVLVNADIGAKAYAILSRIARKMPEQAKSLNPIGLLDLMGREDGIALCPLVYGYVNYSRPAPGRKLLRFHNAPRAAGGHPVGTLGGTGIGFSKRFVPDPALKAHVLWLMGKHAQCGFIPAHDGQPSRREAWLDAGVNAAWGDFYINTADTLEHSYVRPRHSGYIAFQTAASAALRESFEKDVAAGEVLEHLQKLYAKSRNGGER